ncbi:hypothetical protein ASF88_11395 [Leifsonia sp. Leaf336]|uniref:hypothetical protein n=1 Tax=Leifsonia sp. Leaf336 TaxID=1736341 RepID=UPI000702018A|nr:hypothetical protein [Leifsonia sp. Leaf336]KQR52167.1 hypothetical protein ASF88_11395 [Leifsonia sp. Leaf336]
MRPRKWLRALAAFAGALLVGSLIQISAVPEPASAALAGSQFNPGNIISDDVFFNYTAMSQPAIQTFLTQVEVGCTASNGQPCLKDYRMDTYSRPDAGANRCTPYTGAAGELASMIIWKVAQACKINPQVLLVTLQKEQGLVTSTAPYTRMYQVAMGYACPDTSACDAQYYGFYNQVYKAAWQFRTYTRDPYSWNFYPGVRPIQYNTNPACGASNVTIQNQATANLYNYTPYQPNAAALANLWGVGDACSAYGNRNFWAYFNTWFGSSLVSTGPLAIQAAYTAAGGGAGPLGQPISSVLSIADNGGGLGQAFQGGSIYWTYTTGAQVVLAGPILNYYFARNGAAGPLGWPMSGTLTISGNGGGLGQVFTAGSVYSSAAGAFLVRDAMRDAYFKVNGSAGLLGWPTGEIQCGLTGDGCLQAFQNGRLYANPAAGFAYPTAGRVLAAYLASGGDAGPLGLPIGPTGAVDANGGGTAQAFANGSLYSATGGGDYIVSGGILAYYFTLKGSAGALGWPAGAASCDAAKTTCTQAFQNGSIAWSATGAGRLASPQIDAAYASAGGPAGTLGAATSDYIPMQGNGGGMARAYANGSIYWTGALGAFAVSGGIRQVYFSLGGSTGSIGWPKGAASCTGTACSQAFQNGTIAGSPATGSYPVLAAVNAAYVTAGGASGALGLPTTAALPIAGNGGGVGQVFAGGSIFAASGGAGYPVSGGIRDYYFALGGANGSAGWPVAVQSCTGSTCTQKFSRGTITYTTGTGGGFRP